MLVTKSWLQKNYNKYNNLLWNGNLPNIKLKIGRAKNTWGYAAFNYDYVNDTIIPEYLTISNYYDSPEEVKICTLLHEMIHIADYTFHPEHFIKNHRRVSGWSYDAHGFWFKQEAERIYKETGHKIGVKVTHEEQKISKVSKKYQATEKNKLDNALIGAIYGSRGIVFYFKTSKEYAEYVKHHTIGSYRLYYTLGEIRKIKFYTVKDKRYANIRSCKTNLKGWQTTYDKFNNLLERIEATEYYVK